MVAHRTSRGGSVHLSHLRAVISHPRRHLPAFGHENSVLDFVTFLLIQLVTVGVDDVFGPIGTATSGVLTVAWIVAICNAINFLDNMDGLAAGVAAIAAAIFLAATIINGQWFTAAAFALLCGALLGFLLQNVPPA